MSLADVLAAALWIAVTLYAVLGGADFGGGFWDLLAGNTDRGAAPRALIEKSIGPVWEANHVWLIFALVLLWTGFPAAFSAVTSTLVVPLLAVAIGVILRGAAFAFRKPVAELAMKRFFGLLFAASSVVTPFFLGTVAGGVASGRVPPGNAAGSIVRSWLNPTSALGGILAVLTCAFLAAVYLTADATRGRDDELAEYFRRRALLAGVVVGGVALAGIGVLNADAAALFDGLTGRALPLVLLSAVAGGTTLVLLWRRAYVPARVTAALAVAAIIWGWGAAQYPDLLVGSLTIDAGASPPAVLRILLVSLAIGAAILVPSLWYLFSLFQKDPDAGISRVGQGSAPPA